MFSKTSDDQSALFINDTIAENKRMDYKKEKKKPQKDEEGDKLKVY